MANKFIRVASISGIAHASLSDIASLLGVSYGQLAGAATMFRKELYGNYDLPEKDDEKWLPIDEALVAVGRVGYRAGDSKLANCIRFLRKYQNELVGKIVDYETIGRHYSYFQHQANDLQAVFGDTAYAAYWGKLTAKFDCRPFKILPMKHLSEAQREADSIAEKIRLDYGHAS